MPALTLGTAGHIDHGKTALVTRLTGKNTDRLEEERERGISIELGYAELELPGGTRLSVVDVPGHERFVRTMVAGASGIDLFLLVVAADDGVMPQTREHVAILELLGVERGVVAVTKADLVDDELLEIAVDDVREFLSETPYAEAEVVVVSARDGRGLGELVAALERCAAAARAGERRGPARLPVDRVFALKGIGTIVTGTLWQGRISANDTLVAVPGGRSLAVRSVQVHDQETAAANAGSRVGVNLRGDREGLRRGQWLVDPRLAKQTARRLEASVQLLPGAPRLRASDRLRWHHGTSQFIARLVPIGAADFATARFFTVYLDSETAVAGGDRFVVRTLSPATTIGGGRILTYEPRHWHSREQHLAFLSALDHGDDATAVAALAADLGERGLTAADLAFAGFSAQRVAAAATASGAIEELASESAAAAGAGRRWFAAGIAARLEERIATTVTELSAARPERPFVAPAELLSHLVPVTADTLEAISGRLVDRGILASGDGGYASAAANPLTVAQSELADVLAAQLAAEPFAPPTLALLVDQLGASSTELAQLLDYLVREQRAVRIGRDLWFAAPAVDRARAELLDMFAQSPEVTLAAFRDRLACGRRNAQALLEHFDGEGLTLRRGEARTLRRRRR